MYRRTVISILAGALSVPIIGIVNAASVFTGSTPDIAINGYDPVGYFTMNKPVKGSTEHTLEYEGVRWLFASAENKAAFEADPAKYAPKYGGYCAYAVAQGAKADTDPEAFSIVDGNLYLNYSKGVRERWESDKATYIKNANKNWPNLN